MRFKARFLRATAFPIAIYGVESCAMTSAGKKRVGAFDMWCYQIRPRVPWMERKTNKLIGVGQGSALSPLLFIIIMDVLASELGSKTPESMLFADDLVLCETSREKVEQELERWRSQFE